MTSRHNVRMSSAASRKGGRGETRPRQQQQVQIKQQHRKIYSVTKGLRSVQTERQYDWHFRTFKKWLGLRYKTEVIDDEMLLDWNVKELENLIIEYLDEYLHKEKNLKRSSINSAMAAILHFCEVNDIWDIRRRKIAMFIPEDEDHKEDRYYERDEIGKILKESDKRLRVVFLLLANSLRIGAIPQLELRDLKPWPLSTDDSTRSQKVYQIWVYNRSKKGRHYMFVTPECSQAIDDYLKWRTKETGEDTTITPESEYPLIREQFSLTKPRRKDVGTNPWKISQSSLEKIIQRIIEKALGKHTKGTMLTHSFRKFAITMMAESNVNYGVREYLVGHKHSRGLDNAYVLSKPEKRLVEWSKCINALTIKDESFHLQKELQLYKDEYAKRIAELSQRVARGDKERERLTKGFLDYQEKQIEDRMRFEKMKQIYNEGIKKLGLSTELDKDGFLIPPDE